ncbi:hypothetical protein, partial [Acidithiobacillus thiooxidans]|uniref:hypothetical protein n=1 Tax=Acidithiobacillus thiooxidans TaxID=930 RepID=UPI001C06B2E5
MMQLPSIRPQRDPNTGIVTIDNEPVIFHCNHYNRFLQLVVEDSSLDIQPGSAGFLFSIFATKVLDTVIVPCGRPFGKKGRPMR